VQARASVNACCRAVVPAPDCSKAGSLGRCYAIVLGIPRTHDKSHTPDRLTGTMNPPKIRLEEAPFLYNLILSDWAHEADRSPLTMSWVGRWWDAAGWRKREADWCVDANAKPVDTMGYLDAGKAAALAGQVYTHEVGFTLVGMCGHPNIHLNPFYKSFCPALPLLESQLRLRDC